MKINGKLVALCFGTYAAFLGSLPIEADVVTPITAGCIGSCGTDSGGNGDVLPYPGFGSYTYITSTNGTPGGGNIPLGVIGAETDGSTLTTGVFTASAGDQLQYYFNYITSDGAGFPDYAWVELEDSVGSPVALLFTAQTEPTGSISPAPALPAPSPGVILTPASVPISAGSAETGGPVWSELGSWSGYCYAAGCGLTGWVQSDYTIPTGGNYQLAFGVTNLNDELYDSGLAIDGVTIGGTPIPVGTTPEPSFVLLLGAGVAAIVIFPRRRLARTTIG